MICIRELQKRHAIASNYVKLPRPKGEYLPALLMHKNWISLSSNYCLSNFQTAPSLSSTQTKVNQRNQRIRMAIMMSVIQFAEPS